MIISASRKCDIPNYASDWFIDSVQRGYIAYPVNPFLNRELWIKPENTECIVFWTKNPEPMLPRLHELNDYTYYFQFTLTGYARNIEPGIPDKHYMIKVFQNLSSLIGKERVIWRYDPIFISHLYTVDYHKRAFSQIAAALDGYTDRCVFSFLDLYGKVKGNMERVKGTPPTLTEATDLAAFMAKTARAHHMGIETCAEHGDFSRFGIRKGHCIDADLISRLSCKRIDDDKDISQRPLCGCCKSIDIGTYHTCGNGCVYCYAN